MTPVRLVEKISPLRWTYEEAGSPLSGRRLNKRGKSIGQGGSDKSSAPDYSTNSTTKKFSEDRCSYLIRCSVENVHGKKFNFSRRLEPEIIGSFVPVESIPRRIVMCDVNSPRRVFLPRPRQDKTRPGDRPGSNNNIDTNADSQPFTHFSLLIRVASISGPSLLPLILIPIFPSTI